MTILTTPAFDLFFNSLQDHVVSIYARDYDTDEVMGDADDLSEVSTQQLFEVTRTFWNLTKHHIAIFLHDINSPHTGYNYYGGEVPLEDGSRPWRSSLQYQRDTEDMTTLDSLAYWFACSFGGVGPAFTDTTLGVMQFPEDDNREYDGNASQEMLDQYARLFLGEVNIYGETKDTVLSFDCAPSLTLRFGDVRGLTTYPATIEK